MPTGARVHVRRRLPVSLNLPLFPRRHGLLFSTAANQGFLAVATPPRKGACGRPMHPCPCLLLLPFRSIIIVAQGDYARTSSRTSLAGEHCVMTSSFAHCHGIVFTIIIINDHGSDSQSRNVSCSAIKHR